MFNSLCYKFDYNNWYAIVRIYFVWQLGEQMPKPLDDKIM